MLKDFRTFILRGNVVDLAVGVIIGAAFGKIVSSLVSDIFMPPLGLLLGKIDFSQYYIPLSGDRYASLAEAKAAGAPVIAIGAFINTLVEFLLLALVVFFIVRLINRLHQTHPAPPPEASEKTCELCLSTIPRAAVRCKFCAADLPAKRDTVRT